MSDNGTRPAMAYSAGLASGARSARGPVRRPQGGSSHDSPAILYSRLAGRQMYSHFWSVGARSSGLASRARVTLTAWTRELTK
jgi:hypothetical protein